MTLIEKSETGWWFVKLTDGKEGWAPSDFLTKVKKPVVAVVAGSGKGKVSSITDVAPHSTKHVTEAAKEIDKTKEGAMTVLSTKPTAAKKASANGEATVDAAPSPSNPIMPPASSFSNSTTSSPVSSTTIKTSTSSMIESPNISESKVYVFNPAEVVTQSNVALAASMRSQTMMANSKISKAATSAASVSPAVAHRLATVSAGGSTERGKTTPLPKSTNGGAERSGQELSKKSSLITSGPNGDVKAIAGMAAARVARINEGKDSTTVGSTNPLGPTSSTTIMITGKSPSGKHALFEKATTFNSGSDARSGKEAEQYEALDNYTSPEIDGLSFKKGDVFEVIEKNESGWFYSRQIGGEEREGWVPSSYLNVKKITKASAEGSTASVDGGQPRNKPEVAMRQDALSSKVKIDISAAAPSQSSTPSSNSAPSTKPSSMQSTNSTSTGVAAARPSLSLPRKSPKPSLPVKNESIGNATAGKSASSTDPLSSSSSLLSSSSVASNYDKPGVAAKGKIKTKPGTEEKRESHEKYRVVDQYTKEDEFGLSIAMGDVLDLVEKSDSGWWFMRNPSSTLEGWVPSTFLALVASGGTGQSSSNANGPVERVSTETPQQVDANTKVPSAPTITARPVATVRSGTNAGMGTKSPAMSVQGAPAIAGGASVGGGGNKKAGSYVAIDNYSSPDADGFSFKVGSVIDVIEKSDSGWWFGRLDGKEGWIPSTFLKEQ